MYEGQWAAWRGWAKGAVGQVVKGGGPRYGWSGQTPGFGFCAVIDSLVVNVFTREGSL